MHKYETIPVYQEATGDMTYIYRVYNTDSEKKGVPDFDADYVLAMKAVDHVLEKHESLVVQSNRIGKDLVRLLIDVRGRRNQILYGPGSSVGDTHISTMSRLFGQKKSPSSEQIKNKELGKKLETLDDQFQNLRTGLDKLIPSASSPGIKIQLDQNQPPSHLVWYEVQGVLELLPRTYQEYVQETKKLETFFDKLSPAMHGAKAPIPYCDIRSKHFLPKGVQLLHESFRNMYLQTVEQELQTIASELRKISNEMSHCLSAYENILSTHDVKMG